MTTSGTTAPPVASADSLASRDDIERARRPMVVVDGSSSGRWRRRLADERAGVTDTSKRQNRAFSGAFEQSPEVGFALENKRF